MLNMLIAIMGDTFERVIENKDVNAIKTKLELIGDLVAISNLAERRRPTRKMLTLEQVSLK